MSKKKTGKYAAKKKKSNKGLVAVLVIIVLLLVALLAVMLLGMSEDEAEPVAPQTQTTVQMNATEPVQTAPDEMAAPADSNAVNLGFGLQVADMGGYTGMYMEDGSDEILSDILMLVVENTGDKDIQYAQITMNLGDEQAQFELTTLPVGDCVVLLEKNRMQWQDDMRENNALPMASNVAYFQEPLNTMEDKLQISILNGALNVTNISEEDISGTISVYYKNAAADIYYGGITYRVQIKGGLKSGAIQQIMTRHASETGSRIMFVTVSQ